MRQNSITMVIICFLTGGTLLLGGCTNSEKKAELEAYVKRIKSRSIREIEPLPEVRPYETFTYNDSNLRSPFVPSIPQVAAKKVENENGIHPDVNRHKEPLEAYPLDSLRMVGTLQRDSKVWAIVVDPKGTVHRITKGNYVGQNDGRVDNITEEKVKLTEIIPDASGGWRERDASMALIQDDKPSQGKKKDSH